MLRRFLPLTLAASLTAVLLAAPLVFAQTAPAPTPAPAAPSTPAAPKKPNHVGGKISALDAAARTLTVTHHKKETMLTVSADAKIYKPGDAKGSPTGTWADLTLGTQINAHITGDQASPTATEIHIHAPKGAAPAAPAVPATPAAPAAP